MASGGSLPSLMTTVTDGEEYISAQEEVESASGSQTQAVDQTDIGNGVRGTDENESDDEVDINELTVFIPKIPQPQLPYFSQSQSVKPTAKSKNRIQLIQQETSQIRKIVCGVVVLLIIFGLAAVMIMLALMFNIDDLFIIGGIFIFGGSLFTIGFIIVRCTIVLPYDKADSAIQSSIRKDASTPKFDVY